MDFKRLIISLLVLLTTLMAPITVPLMIGVLSGGLGIFWQIIAIVFMLFGFWSLIPDSWKNKQQLHVNSKASVIFFIVVVTLGVVFYLQNQSINKQMIKLDACAQTCGISSYIPLTDPCLSKCREKYGFTLKEYSDWKKKQE